MSVLSSIPAHVAGVRCHTPVPAAHVAESLASRSPRPRTRTALKASREQRQLGQGMTEYLVVVALIAVAAIGVYSLLGQTLRSQTAGLALEISGQDAGSAIGSARAQAGSAQASSATRKGLDNFNEGNR